MNISLRKITENDKKLLFDWANDVETRKNSFNSSPIPWSVHEQWFEDRMHSEGTRIYVAHDEQGNDLGQIRFEKHQDHAVVGLSIDNAFRGKGLGTVLLDKGCEAIFAEWQDIAFVRGKVKRGNEGSSRIWIKANFGEEERDGDTVVYRRFRG
jgi:UDP-2,4-diacetamido-2,4,6-trideoxy-beta-L-altropyranose hydrolase